MSKSTTVFNTSTHIKLDTHSPEEAANLISETKEKCALAIGRQLLKRKLITFETEENPGANAGERKISITGTISVSETKAE